MRIYLVIDSSRPNTAWTVLATDSRQAKTCVKQKALHPDAPAWLDYEPHFTDALTARTVGSAMSKAAGVLLCTQVLP